MPDELLLRLVPAHQKISVATLRDEDDRLGRGAVDEGAESFFVSVTLELEQCEPIQL